MCRYIAGPSALDPEITAENLFKPGLDLPAMSANATVQKVIRFGLRFGGGGGNNNSDAGAGAGAGAAAAAAAAAASVVVDMTFPQDVHAERGAPLNAALQIDCPPAAAANGEGGVSTWGLNYTLRCVRASVRPCARACALRATSCVCFPRFVAVQLV